MKLLVIEDDRKVAGFLEQGFHEEGSAVEVARDGETGLERALAGSHDVILLDFMLPGRSGPEVVAALRAAGSRTPVLVLSARDDPRDIRAALEAGANGYVTKPFRFADLLKTVESLIAGRRPAT